MTSDSSDDEFKSISNANHSRISQKMENMGYGDGVSDGRETQFQKGFDDGYEQGYKNGFLLGKFKGQLAKNELTKNDGKSDAKVQNDLILQRTSRGQCILCTDPSLKDDSIKDIVVKQNEHMKRIESTLESRYASK